MNQKIIASKGVNILVIHSNESIITDSQSALDLLATVHYDHECSRIAINKEAITEDFFQLSTGVAGEILQKVVNYRKKLAIIGDFSVYSSQPLHDFIYECNSGRDIFFVKTEADAVNRLSV